MNPDRIAAPFAVFIVGWDGRRRVFVTCETLKEADTVRARLAMHGMVAEVEARDDDEGRAA